MNEYEKNWLQERSVKLEFALYRVAHARRMVSEMIVLGRDEIRRKTINKVVLASLVSVRDEWFLLINHQSEDALALAILALVRKDTAEAKKHLYNAAQCRNTTLTVMRRCYTALLQAEACLETAVRFSLTLPEGV